MSATDPILSLKPSQSSADAWQACADRAKLSRNGWCLAIFAHLAADEALPAGAVQKARKRAPKGEEPRTHESAAQVSLRLPAKLLELVDKRATAARMGRAPWCILVLDVAAGLSRIDEDVGKLARE